MRRGLVVLLALGCAQGCSSSYEPARSPRIVTVVEGGQPTFVKNGDRIGTPVFGSGLVEAVEGVPEAEHHAIIGRNLVIGGLVLDVAGLGSMIGGIVVTAKDNVSTEPQSNTAGNALLIGGAVAVLAGSLLMLAGQPHIYDAVNIYNDSLEPRPPTPFEKNPRQETPPATIPPPAAPPPGPRASLVVQSAPGRD